MDGRLRFFTIGFSRFNFFRDRRFGFGFARFFHGFRFFAQNVFGGGGGSFAWWGRFSLPGGFSLFGRFGQSGFAHAHGSWFGLRHAQIANGRLRHRQHIRAQSGPLDFLLQFFGLLLEVPRAAFECGFIGGFGFGGGGFFLKETANPFAELKIGQEQQADEAKRQIHNGRTHRTENPEPPVKTK